MTIIYIMMIMTLICVLGGLLLSVIQVLISKEETEATILEINEKKYIREGYYKKETKIMYFPVFEYYVNGNKYIKESFSGSIKKNFEIGEKIKVRYPKNNPEDAFLAKDGNGKVKIGLGFSLYIILIIIFIYIINKL